jgi:soluble lytic murein transglycosylase-like protein
MMIKVNIDIRQAIESIAYEHNIEPDLIEAMVLTESSGNAKAWRYEPAFYAKYIQKKDYPEELKKDLATSWGLMQVMGVVAWEMGLKGRIKETLCTIEGGLEYGVKHFAKFLHKYGNIPDAIASYNAGSPRRKDGIYVNQGYVDKVMKYYIALGGDDA